MNTVLEPPAPPHLNLHGQTFRQVELTRGAAHFGMHHLQVFLSADILRDYSEPDPTLGHNAVGHILSVLAGLVSRHPGGGLNESIAVAVRRRRDAQEVELHLNVVRTRHAGMESICLNKIGECAVPD